MPNEMKEDLKDALAAYNSGAKPRAYLILKQSRNLSVEQAKELLLEASQNLAKGDGMTTDQDAALKEALHAVETFDELTAMVLRHIRESRGDVSVERNKMDPGTLLRLCNEIYFAMADMVAHDVNPTRAMTDFLNKASAHQRLSDGRMRRFDQMTTGHTLPINEMEAAANASLRDDLLSLL